MPRQLENLCSLLTLKRLIVLLINTEVFWKQTPKTWSIRLSASKCSVLKTVAWIVRICLSIHPSILSVADKYSCNNKSRNISPISLNKRDICCWNSSSIWHHDVSCVGPEEAETWERWRQWFGGDVSWRRRRETCQQKEVQSWQELFARHWASVQTSIRQFVANPIIGFSYTDDIYTYNAAHLTKCKLNRKI